MGPERCHRFELEDYPCSVQGCQCTLNAEIEVWEYPLGMEEYRGISPSVNSDDADRGVKVVSE